MSFVSSLTRPVARRLVFSTSSQHAEPCSRTTRMLSKNAPSRNTNRCRIAFDWKKTVLGLHNTTPFSDLPCIVADHMMLVAFPHNGAGSTAFLAQADTHQNPYERSLRFPEHARISPSPSQPQDRPRSAPAMPVFFRQPPFAVVRQQLRTPRQTCRELADGHRKAQIGPQA